MKYPERISSSFTREELIGKFRPSEISVAELLSSSMPRHANAGTRKERRRLRGKGRWGWHFHTFLLRSWRNSPRGKPDTPSLSHFLWYIERNAKFSRLYRSNQRKGDANCIHLERNIFLSVITVLLLVLPVMQV